MKFHGDNYIIKKKGYKVGKTGHLTRLPAPSRPGWGKEQIN